MPQIEETQEEGYEYKYKAAMFEMLIGGEEKPKVKVKQGLRELDIVMEIPFSAADSEVSVSPQPSPSTSDEAAAGEEATADTASVLCLRRKIEEEETIEATATPTPTPTPEELEESKEVLGRLK